MRRLRRVLLITCLMALVVPIFPLAYSQVAAQQGAQLLPDSVAVGQAKPTPLAPGWAPQPIGVPAMVPARQLVEAPGPTPGGPTPEVPTPVPPPSQVDRFGPEVRHTVTCLGGNGRVDTNIVNTSDNPADYRIEFEGLSPRQRRVFGSDWWRMPITGRPDRDFEVVVKRDGVVVSDSVVSVQCDSTPAVVSTPEVTVVNSCRVGNGYILFQFSNPTAVQKGYVIEFEGVSNRSTSAAPYGGAIRAVTGRTDGTYDVTIRSGGVVLQTRQVVVQCDFDRSNAARSADLDGTGVDASVEEAAETRIDLGDQGDVSTRQANPPILVGPRTLVSGQTATYQLQNALGTYGFAARYGATTCSTSNAGITQIQGLDFNFFPATGEWAVCLYELRVNGIYTPVSGLILRVGQAAELGYFGYDEDANLVNLVHPLSGNWVIPRTDMALQSVGGALEVTRVYNSLSNESGPFGVGWTSNIAQQLRFDSNEAKWKLSQPDGRIDVFTADPPTTAIDETVTPDNDDSLWWGPSRFGVKLRITEEPAAPTARVSYRDGSEQVFERPARSQWRLKRNEDPQGNTTSFLYTADGVLDKMRDDVSGREIRFDWTDGRVTSVEVPSPAADGQTVRWSYQYGKQANQDVLIRVCDGRQPVGGVSFCESYGWLIPVSGGAGAQCNPGQPQICAVYDEQGQLIEDVSYTNRGVTKHRSYPDSGSPNETMFEPDPVGEQAWTFVTVTDPLGAVWRYDYEGTRIRRTRAPKVQFVDDNGTVRTNNPGARTWYEYGDDGNRSRIRTSVAAAGAGEAGTTSVTSFEYDQFGSVVAVKRGLESDAALTVERMRYGAFVEGEPQNLEYTCSGGVGRVDVLHTQPIPNGRSKYCQRFVYGPVGADGSAAGLANEVITPIDDNTTATVKYEYHSNGLVRSMTDANGDDTTYIYDEASTWDLLEVVEPTGRKLEYQYNAWGQVEVVIVDRPGEASVRAEVTDYNEVGWPVSVKAPATTSVIDGSPSRLASRSFYDPQGRVQLYVEADIDAPGGVPGLLTSLTVAQMRNRSAAQLRRTEYTYDRLGREILRKVPDATTTASRYDAAGNRVETVDGNGTIRRSVFNEARQVVTECVNPPANGFDCPDSTVTARYELDDGNRRIKERYYAAGGVLRRTVENEYDLADRLTKATLIHPDGRSEALISNSYDIHGRLERTVEGSDDRQLNPTGQRVTEFEFADVWGDRVTATRIDLGRLGAQETTLDYDVNGLVAREAVSRPGAQDIPGPAQHVTLTTRRYVVDVGGGALGSTVSTAVGTVVKTEVFDDRGLLLYSVDENGNRSEFGYDDAYRTVKTTLPAVQVTNANAAIEPEFLVEYNAWGEVVTSTATDRGQAEFVYDSMGRMIERRSPSYTDAVTGQVIAPVESWAYDADGNTVSSTDARGYTTTYTYDAFDRVDIETLPVRGNANINWGNYDYDYDWVGTLAQVTPPSTAPTSYSYDGFDRPRSQTTGSPNAIVEQERIEYDSFGQVTKATSVGLGDDEDLIVDSTYNVLGELLTSTLPYAPGETPEVTSYDYNHLSLVVRETEDKFGWSTEIDLDLWGRPVATKRMAPPTSPGGAADELWRTVRTYEPNGNLETVTTPNGHKTTYFYDSHNRIEKVHEPLPGGVAETKYGYNGAGDLTMVKNANGAETTHAYNPWGLKVATVEAWTEQHQAESDRTFQWVYDEGAMMIQQVEPGADPIYNDYDELGRLIAQGAQRVNGKLVDRVFRYSEPDRGLSEISVPGGSQSFVYDERGLMQTSSYSESPGSGSRFDFDSHRRLERRQDPSSGGDHVFEWYGDGRLKSHVDPVVSRTTQYEWDKVATNGAGIVTSITDQITRSDTVHTTSYATDTGRISSERIVGSNVVRHNVDYDQYDNNGNLQKVTWTTQGRPAETHEYSYDSADRLATWETTLGAEPTTTTTYGYDSLGNRTSATTGNESEAWQYDARNRATSGPDGTYEWDARGTLDKIVKDGEETRYAFDSLGQLSTVVGPDGSAEFEYDALQRLAERNRSFRYAGLATDAAKANGELIGRLADGTAVSVENSDGKDASLVYNFHGDVQLLVDATDAKVEFSVTRDPWGETFNAQGDDSLTQLGYQGDWTDPTTGDVKTDTRWYTPTTGAFRSRDVWNGELQSPWTMNRYLYAGANPVSNSDPTGLKVLEGTDDDRTTPKKNNSPSSPVKPTSPKKNNSPSSPVKPSSPKKNNSPSSPVKPSSPKKNNSPSSPVKPTSGSSIPAPQKAKNNNVSDMTPIGAADAGSLDTYSPKPKSTFVISIQLTAEDIETGIDLGGSTSDSCREGYSCCDYGQFATSGCHYQTSNEYVEVRTHGDASSGFVEYQRVMEGSDGTFITVVAIGAGFVPVLGELVDAGFCAYDTAYSSASTAALSCGAMAIPGMGAALARNAPDAARFVKNLPGGSDDVVPTAPRALSAFSRSSIDDAVTSVSRAHNDEISVGARAIDKRLGANAAPFQGIEATTANARALVTDILENPTRTVFGARTYDVYNAAGQGARFDVSSNRFITFLDETIATR